MSKFKFEIIPHKNGNSWVHIYRNPELNALNKTQVGSSFYLTDEEIKELQQTMNSKVWEYYKKVIERHPEDHQKVIYKVGQRFVMSWKDNYNDWESDEYILSQVGNNTVILINIITGTRWSNSILVGSVSAITEEEMSQLITEKYKFKRIS